MEMRLRGNEHTNTARALNTLAGVLSDEGKQAEAENHKARRMFDYAPKAEAVHAELYQMALEAVQKGQDLPEDKIYLCPICGHIEFGKPAASCPICGAKADKFVQVE